jgi:hypothetical protein
MILNIYTFQKNQKILIFIWEGAPAVSRARYPFAGKGIAIPFSPPDNTLTGNG